MVNVTCVVDTRNLNRAMQVWIRHSKRSPAVCVNATALFVIRDAQNRTPVVSQSRINSDMNVVTSPKVLKSGKLSKAKDQQNAVIEFLNRTPTVEDVSAVNTAMRIVLARMHPNSRYSLLTGNRWPVPMPDTGRGRGRGSGTDSISLFWAYVKQVAERMVRARHSSTGFLKHSWAGIIYKLIPHARGDTAPNIDIGARGEWANFGEVKPAQEGAAIALCRVDNTLGIGNPNDVLSEKYNEAAHQILEPVLQKAIDSEFDKKMVLMSQKEWAKDEPELKSLGVLVKP